MNSTEDFAKIKKTIHRNANLQMHLLSVLATITGGTHYDIHASSPRSTELTLVQVENSCRILANKGLIKFPPKKLPHDDRFYTLTALGKKALEP